MNQIGIQFNVKPGIDRKSFLDGFELGTSVAMMDLPPGTFSYEAPFVKFKMGCGEEYIFNTPSDLPTETFRCHCGNKDHVIVLWTKADGSQN